MGELERHLCPLLSRSQEPGGEVAGDTGQLSGSQNRCPDTRAGGGGLPGGVIHELGLEGEASRKWNRMQRGVFYLPHQPDRADGCPSNL